MYFTIENFKQKPIKELRDIDNSIVIKRKLDDIYEKAPNSSNFFISLFKFDDGDFRILLEVSTINMKIKYSGIHQCISEAFMTATNSMNNQLKDWKKTRFLTPSPLYQGLQ